MNNDDISLGGGRKRCIQDVSSTNQSRRRKCTVLMKQCCFGWPLKLGFFGLRIFYCILILLICSITPLILQFLPSQKFYFDPGFERLFHFTFWFFIWPIQSLIGQQNLVFLQLSLWIVEISPHSRAPFLDRSLTLNLFN